MERGRDGGWDRGKEGGMEGYNIPYPYITYIAGLYKY